MSVFQSGVVDPDLRARRSHGYESARPDVQGHVPRSARRILELGCSTGALGAALKERQDVVVIGVEISDEYASEAHKRLDRVIVADIDSFLSGPAPPEAPFDCLIAADVLEHLVDPWGALRRAVGLLRPRGTVVISVPNVAYWRALWRLIRTGRWPLDDEGVFDRTHLRWFTRDDALDLLRQADLEPVAVEPLYGWANRWWRLWRRAAAKTALHRFLTSQYVMSAVKLDASQSPHVVTQRQLPQSGS